MKLDVYNTEKKKVGAVDLPDEIFAAEVNEAVLWDEVKAQLASRRRGTVDTTTQGTVRGGRAKPYAQKHTGRARQGSTVAPHHVGGGKAMGPHPRDWKYRPPRSQRRTALRTALSVRARESHLWVLDGVEMKAPKTKSVVELLERFEIPSALIVDVENTNLSRSIRNLPKSKYVAVGGINVYDILDHEHLILTQAALPEVIKRAQKARAS
jgi:large subunit ribosomal protein L4